MSKNEDSRVASPARPVRLLAKMMMVLAASLMGVVAFAPVSAAQQAVPSFVSPNAELGPLVGGQIVVEVDHAGLDIASGWIFAGSEPGAGDYAMQHMASNTTAVVSGLPTFFQTSVYFTYFYLEVDGTWKTISTVGDAIPRPFLVEPEEESFFTCCTMDIEVFGTPAAMQSSWILVGSTSGASDLGALHLGTNTTGSLVIAPPSLGQLIFVTYFWKVGGLWNSFETVLLDELPIF